MSDEITTYDGGALVCFTSSWWTNPLASYLTLIKKNSDGTIVWVHRFDSCLYNFRQVVQLPDSGFFIAVFDGLGTTSTVMLRVDKNGNLVYQNRAYLPPGWDYFNNHPIALARNGNGVYVALTARDSTTLDLCTQLVSLDANGNITWSNYYHIGVDAQTYAMDTATNGNILLLNNNWAVYGSPMIDCISPAGNLIWSKIYSFAGNYIIANAIAHTAGDQFYVSSLLLQSPGEGMAFFKIDGQGNLVWSYKYMGHRVDGAEIKVLPNGESLVAGGIFQTSGTFFRIDSMGTLLAYREFNGYFIQSIDITNSGNIILSGLELNTFRLLSINTDFNGVGCLGAADTCTRSPLAITVTTATGFSPLPLTQVPEPHICPPPAITLNLLCNGTGIESTKTRSLKIYPNPATELIAISASTQVEHIELTNMLGEMVLSSDVNGFEFTFNVSHLPNGIYCLNCRSTAGLTTVPIVVAR